MGPKLVWCKLRQSIIHYYHQNYQDKKPITHKHKNLHEKNHFSLKEKKQKEILQVKFTIKEKSYYFFFSSLTLFFFLIVLTTKPQSFFTTMHIASSLSFFLYFATLIKVSQILIDLCALQNLLSTTPKFCCLFLALRPRQKSHFKE